MRRADLRRLVAAGVIGLLMTIGIAWTATWASILPPAEMSSDRHWPPGTPASWPEVRRCLECNGVLLTGVRHYLVDSSLGGVYVADTLRAGWPLRALEATRFDPSPTVPVSHAHSGLALL